MDIRSFFGGKKTPGLAGMNAMSAEGNAASSIAEVVPKKRSQKLEAVMSKKEKRSKKNATVPLVVLSEGDDSEGESPIPASLRKEALKRKSSRTPIDSDSDEDMPRKKAPKNRVRPVTPSPVKSPLRAKRSRVVVCDSDGSETRSPKKPMLEKVLESGDEEVSGETDSENEFLEKKKSIKKKSNAPAQEKKAHPKAVKKATPIKEKKTEKVERVKASEVFGKGAGTVGKTAVEPSPNKKDVRVKSSKVSPSQKENAIGKAKEKVHEFVEDDDGFRSSKDVIKTDRVTPSKPSKKTTESDKRAAERKPTPQKDQKGKAALQVHGKPKSASSTQSRLDTGAVYVPWVEKYRPRNAAQLVGQHGEKSPMNKLLGWLKDWASNNLGEGGKVKKPKPPPFLAQTDGAPFKAVLLSGSPGVGKTTCAVMACETLGLKIVEMNASDVRSKKSLEQQISQLTDSHQIEEYFTSTPPNGNDEEVKHVLIMDEVDGMSGTEDRAGISELIQIIKESKIPIICICNDRQHPKIRSLANHCFDVRFQKPRVEQIRARLMSIACQEKLKISKEELDQMIELSGHDVRQSIYSLQLYSSAGGKSQVQKKDVAVGPFEAARKLLDSRSTLQEKQDMFFVDYGIMPLFVQENYPNMRNDKHTPKQALNGLRKAADLISYGDTFERCIRSTGAWKLLNEQGIIGCALPSIAVGGHLRAMIQFPAWLGKNSTSNKRHRLARQLAMHSQLKISADMHSLVADYVPALRDRLTKPLLERETDGVFDVVCTMNDYDLIREDAEAISELAVWPGKIDPASKILPKVKSALTRALNKEHRMLPYETDDIGKSRRKTQAEFEVEVDEYGNIVEKVNGEESGFEDDSEDEDYKPGSKSKAKAKPAVNAVRGRARGGSVGGTSRGGAKRGRGK